MRTYFLEDVLEKTGYRLTAENQIDDYGQDRAWKSNKQFIKKRKSQIASAVEVDNILAFQSIKFFKLLVFLMLFIF